MIFTSVFKFISSRPLHVLALLLLIALPVFSMPTTVEAQLNRNFRFLDYDANKPIEIVYTRNLTESSSENADERYIYQEGSTQPYIFKGVEGRTKDGIGWEIHIFYDETGSNRAVSAMAAEYFRPGGTFDRVISVQGTSTFYRYFPDPPNNLEASKEAAERIAEVRSTSGTSEESPSCASASEGFGWLLCPLINLLDGSIDFLDQRIQGLLLVPTEDYANPQLRETWARFRNIAYIILVPIILVMVIGTAVGSDFVNAYTVKKALPRFIFAVIFIALSWHIVTFMITATNVVGRGVLGLMTASVDGSATVTLKDIVNTDESAGLTFTALILLIAGFATEVLTLGIIFSYAFTVFLVLLTVFVLLTVRQILIVMLAILAPLAILAWIFPANTKLWGLWWGTFTKLLFMFPLIMLLVGAGRIMAQVIDLTPENSVGDGITEPLLKITAYLAPYFFIPFTFKYAGGLMANLAGIVNDKERGIFDRQKKKRQERMSQGWERNVSRKVLQKRADWQNRLQKQGSSGNWAKKFASRRLARGIGGHNIQALDSARRAAVQKELYDQINTGRDDEIRGLTVNKEWADNHGEVNVDKRVENGVKQYRTLGGHWVNEGAVLEGHRRWGRDTYAQQAALSYEMRKAAEDGEVQRIADHYQTVAMGSGGWNMTRNQAAGALKGAGFENQGTHLEFKHMRVDGTVNYAELAKEFYEKKNTYSMANMSAHNIQRLEEAYDWALQSGDNVTVDRVRGVAEAFMQRGGAAGIAGIEGEGDQAQPVFQPQLFDPAGYRAAGDATDAEAARARGEFFQTYSAGPAHVNERVRDFAVKVGVYQRDVDAPKTTSRTPPPDGPGFSGPVDVPRQH